MGYSFGERLSKDFSRLFSESSFLCCTCDTCNINLWCLLFYMYSLNVSWDGKIALIADVWMSSWHSLFRTRLSRITAYLGVENWSMPKHENLTTGKKNYCGKEEKLLLRSNFFSFPQYFQHISNFKSPITYPFDKCGCSIYVFLNSANLICRSTDISKYFREYLGILNNESRLY